MFLQIDFDFKIFNFELRIIDYGLRIYVIDRQNRKVIAFAIPYVETVWSH